MTRVLVVGTGLVGASLGMALRKSGKEVFLSDPSLVNVRLAVDYGAGVPVSDLGENSPDLVVVCVPPDSTAGIVAQNLNTYPTAVVTDVASVKASILAELAELVDPAALKRYVGSHPMAGREKAGPASARADLFYSRPWIISASNEVSKASVALVKQLALDVRAMPLELNPVEHDQAVALVSHLPQLIATVLAGQLQEEHSAKLVLAGQGLRDTVRIAASDPELWMQIVSRNAEALLPLVTKLSNSLDELRESLANISSPGSLKSLHQLLLSGNQGVARIPGKHGGSSVNYQTVTVLIDDRPGQLARLLTEVGEVGVNLEDLNLEHSPGAPIGIVELMVLPEVVDTLARELVARGWRLT